jgi:hypothetical protein
VDHFPSGEWISFRAARPDLALTCTACGEKSAAEEFVPAAIEAELATAAYIAVKDGGEDPYTTCRNCGADAYPSR